MLNRLENSVLIHPCWNLTNIILLLEQLDVIMSLLDRGQVEQFLSSIMGEIAVVDKEEIRWVLDLMISTVLASSVIHLLCLLLDIQIWCWYMAQEFN